MNDLDLQLKLTREMSSKDYCHQRIFSCYPLLWKLYGEFMSETKNYNFPVVFLEVIKEWNIERNKDAKEFYDNYKYDMAIAELKFFYNMLCQIYDKYHNDNYVHVNNCNKILEMDMQNYKDISLMCRIYQKDDNRSKVLCRLKTLKKKTSKFLSGIITIEQFMEKEIKPQKEFLKVFLDKLELFDKNQFCIFMLCYDIKKTNQSIFANKGHNIEDPFTI